MTGPPALFTLNPANGAPLTSVPTVEFYGSLAVRTTAPEASRIRARMVNSAS